MRPMHRYLSASLGIAVLVMTWATCGCSSFRGEARRARATVVPAGSLEGLWTGRWQEQSRGGHGGRMDLVLTRTGETLYRASTRSQWWGVFTSAYDLRVVAIPTAPGQAVLQGGRDLWLFGNYSLLGKVEGDRLEATFEVGGRKGTLSLTRPGSTGTNGPGTGEGDQKTSDTPADRG